MPVVMLIALLAILVAAFLVATGRGGELAYEQVDHAPLNLGPVSPTDVALLRPPTALWGYNMQVTDDALDQIARALRDRDIEIAYLQRQLADLGFTDYERPRDFVPKHERPAETTAIEAPLAGVGARPDVDVEPGETAGDENQPAEATRAEGTRAEGTRAGATPGEAPGTGDADDPAAEEQGW